MTIIRSFGFIALCVVAFSASSVFLHLIGVSLHTEGSEEGPKSLLNGLALCAISIAATATCAKFEGRPVLSYGLREKAVFTRFGSGFAVGLLLFGVLIGSVVFAHAISFKDNISSWEEAIWWGLFWAVSYFLVALSEETLFRGYLLSTLAERFGPATAVAITSFLIGAIHLANGSESVLAAFNAMLLGAVLASSILRTGSIWWAVGLHAAWDWFESFIAGSADSGIKASGRLFDAFPQGAPILSGGEAGPEGSLLMLASIALGVLVVAVVLQPLSLHSRVSKRAIVARQ